MRSSEFRLREQPTICVVLEAYRSQEPTDDGYRGVVAFAGETIAVVDKHQTEIGSVGIGGEFIVFRDYRRPPGETEYVVPIEDLWRAFQKGQEAGQ